MVVEKENGLHVDVVITLHTSDSKAALFIIPISQSSLFNTITVYSDVVIVTLLSTLTS